MDDAAETDFAAACLTLLELANAKPDGSIY
jgi:hypothetical protein